jgi:hypothetical protein
MHSIDHGTILNNSINVYNGVNSNTGLYNVANSIMVNNMVCVGNGTDSTGIISSGGNSIFNNIITGGGGTTAAGVSLTGPGDSIENNIIFAASPSTVYGIREDAPSADPASVDNNNIFHCPTALYYDHDMSTSMFGINGSGNFTANADGTGAQLTTPTASGNNDENNFGDRLFLDIDGPDNTAFTLSDNDWHFQTDGSAPCTVTTGGLDQTAFFNAKGIDLTDIDGNGRDDALWSIGAYEYDGSCM